MCPIAYTLWAELASNSDLLSSTGRSTTQHHMQIHCTHGTVDPQLFLRGRGAGALYGHNVAPPVYTSQSASRKAQLVARVVSCEIQP
jgi:hypothetical protein